MERDDRMGESAPQYPKPAGAQHNVDESCQPRSGTSRSDAQPALIWDYVDSDIALRRGLGYLHARDGFNTRGLPATSTVLVDRPASDPSSTSAAKRGFWSDDDFDKTVKMTRPDVENVQLHCDETQRLTTQLLPADAVASSEARLTTRDSCHERTAGPYSPDSYSLPRLLEGATATVTSVVELAVCLYSAPEFCCRGLNVIDDTILPKKIVQSARIIRYSVYEIDKR